LASSVDDISKILATAQSKRLCLALAPYSTRTAENEKAFSTAYAYVQRMPRRAISQGQKNLDQAPATGALIALIEEN